METNAALTQISALEQSLADFRCELRRFLQRSELAAVTAGLQPQQHQLLLQIAGAPEETVVTIAYAAERLGLKHNSAVELVGRCEQEGLLRRGVDPIDRRRAVLRLSAKGRRILDGLSQYHAQELTERAPELIRTLSHIRRVFQGATAGPA